MIERIEDIYWYDFRYLMILSLWRKVLLFVLAIPLLSRILFEIFIRKRVSLNASLNFTPSMIFLRVTVLLWKANIPILFSGIHFRSNFGRGFLL